MARVVVFDLGGVLVDWDPRNLYRKLLPSEEEVETFLTTVCTQAWNEQQDAGRPAQVAVAELSMAHPSQAPLIAAYYARFGEMIAGLFSENVAVLDSVIAANVSVYALTNWSADTFGALEAFDLLDRFGGRVLVSGREGVKKPDPAIYRLFCRRFDLEPSEILFIDDALANVRAARAAGWGALHYRRGEPLGAALSAELADGGQSRPRGV